MSDDIIKPGKYVGLTYRIVDCQGELVEERLSPVGFVFGGDTELIGGLDKAVAGHRVGDEVTVKVSAQDAYGQRDENLIFTDDLANVPEEYRHVGAEVEMHSQDGASKVFYVTDISHGRLTLDGNHPLAGRELTIRVQITEVREARPGEEETSGIHAALNPAHPTIN